MPITKIGNQQPYYFFAYCPLPNADWSKTYQHCKQRSSSNPTRHLRLNLTLLFLNLSKVPFFSSNRLKVSNLFSSTVYCKDPLKDLKTISEK